MGFAFVCFLVGIMLCYLVLTYKDGLNAASLTEVFRSHDTRILLIEKRLKTAEDSIKVKIDIIQSCLNQYDKANNMSLDLKDETKSLYEYCEKLKLQQIELQDKLSNKRPVIVLKSEIPVQIIKGKGINSLIKSKQ